MAGCSWVSCICTGTGLTPPRASAPGLGSPPARICTGTAGASRGHAEACAAVSTGSDRCAHTRDSVRRARGAIDTPCVCFVFACVCACVPVFGFCLNVPACLPHACDVSARAHVFTPRAFALQVDPMQFHQAVRKYYSWHDVAARTELVYRSGIIRCNGVPVP